MGTAEDYDVRTCLKQGFQTCGNHRLHFRARELPLFDKFHETPSHMFYNIDMIIYRFLGFQILGAFQRAGGSQNSDRAGNSSQRSRLHGRFHTDELHRRVLGTEDGNGSCSGSIAGDHDDVGAFFKQGICYRPGPVLNKLRCFLAIRAISVIRVIYILFCRQKTGYLFKYRQPAFTGIENSDHILIYVISPGHIAIHLTQNLQEWSTLNKSQSINSIIHTVILVVVQNKCIIVLRKFLDESSCRRHNHLILTIIINNVEHAVIIVIVLVGISVTLNQSEAVCYFIRTCGRIRIHGNLTVLGHYGGIVLSDYPVLLIDITVIRIDGAVCTINIRIISEVHSSERYVSQ